MSKADLHRLVDELPESEEHAAKRFLEYLRDRTIQPDIEEFDEEPLSEDEQAALSRGLQDIQAGRVVSFEEYLATQDEP